MKVWTAALGAAFVAAGCAGGPAPLARPPADGGVSATIRARIVAPAGLRAPEPGSYGLQAVVSGYTAANVDHVGLRLSRAGTSLPGAVLNVANASLGAPITVRNLRAATRYEVQATAWADAAETTAISNAAASTTAFTTPAVATADGVATIDDAALAVPVAVTLAQRAVGARLVFKVVPTQFMRNKATHVRIRLLAGPTTLGERVETMAQAEANHTLTNLKLGTAYALVAQGLTLAPEVQQSTDADSTLGFTTPAAGGTSVEDDMNVMLGASPASVPCSK